MRSRRIVLIVLALCAAMVGCSNTLETGYKPQSLGASAAVRRSYYASPFTPDADAAEQEQREQFQAQHQRAGY